MKKKGIAMALTLGMLLSMAPATFAASNEAVTAANKLYELGLFSGTGTDANGNPIFDLDRAPTRQEAITMLVNLLGKSEEARAGSWTTPFTDVADWAKPYVGYAYANGLTSGVSATTFGGNHTVSATQYLTFVLRTLGYENGTDFQWDKAWELSDKLGITYGQYNATSAFTRGDVAIVSYNALSAPNKWDEFLIDDELKKAFDTGLLPEGWLSDLSKPVTIAEFNQQLTKLVEMRDPALVEKWETFAVKALQMQETAQRDDVILSIFESAIVMGIDKEEFNYIENEWEGRVTGIDWWEGRTYDYDYFPNWNDIYPHALYTDEYPVHSHSAWYVERHISRVSEKHMIEPTEQWTFGFDLDVSREEAARALVRFMECSPAITYGEKNYITLSDVGTYNKEIITDELLNKASDLPEVTQDKFPSEWQGAGIAARKRRAEEYYSFEESDIRFLAESGFNFTRLFFDFRTLRYPDFPADTRMVNEQEFEELDQLLAWCMEYDIHLQLAMAWYLDENGNSIDVMPRTDAEWALVRDYWAAIAKRYAGIPNEYLTFDLCNEIYPREQEDVSYAKNGLTAVVDAIRSEDNERVLLYSFPGFAGMEWAKILGELNVGIGCHPYRPHRLCGATYPDTEFLESNLYWPRPHFTSVVPENEEITICGEGLEGTLSVYTSRWGSIQIYADGTSLGVFDLIPENEETGYFDEHQNNKTISVEIPVGTKQIRIKSTSQEVFFNAVGVKNDNFHTWLMCHDAYEYIVEGWGGSNLVVDQSGVWSNADGLVIDAEYAFDIAIKPLMEIADQYQVGFVVNEFGLYGVEVYWDIEAVVSYHDDFLKMLEAHDIGWSYCEIANRFPKHLVILTGGESQWAGATVETVTYTFDDGSSDTIVICKELLDIFRKYTTK